jgi:hypothetical protein
MDSGGPLVQADGSERTPLRIAFERFSNTLSSKERTIFTDASLNDVLLKVREIDERHTASSKLRCTNQRLEQFLKFLQRYSKAVDCMVQIQPNPSALIWGLLRMGLEVRNISERIENDSHCDLRPPDPSRNTSRGSLP